MSSYSPYQRAPQHVIDEGIRLWKLKKPPSKISTRRALRLLERYNPVIDELSNYGNPYDDVMATDLISARDNLQAIVDRRLSREQYDRVDGVN